MSEQPQPRPEPCPRCQGARRYNGHPCTSCGGSGWVAPLVDCPECGRRHRSFNVSKLCTACSLAGRRPGESVVEAVRRHKREADERLAASRAPLVLTEAEQLAQEDRAQLWLAKQPADHPWKQPGARCGAGHLFRISSCDSCATRGSVTA